MACHHLKLPNGATAIVCGVKPPQRCRFCAHESKVLCDWPMLKTTRIAVSTLKRGQKLMRGKIEKPEVLVVQAIERVDEVYRKIILGNMKTGQTVEYVEPNFGLIQTFAKKTCSAPACEIHAREVGENKHYCQDHWQAWETAQADAAQSMLFDFRKDFEE